MTRILTLTIALLAVGACSSSPTPKLPANTFRVGFISDVHIIDQYYQGPENTPLDTESLYHSAERLTKARQTINDIVPAVEQLFVTGDILHQLDSPDPAFYDEHYTAFDIAAELFAGFAMPVHLGFGNHDYDPTQISRAASEAIYEKKLGIPAAYYTVTYKGWQFIHLNCFEGYTWDPTNPDYESANTFGSFGQTQLDWLDTQLSAGLPSVLMFHIPMPFIEMNEYPGLDLFTVIAKHPDTAKLVIAGHLHLWLEFGSTYGPPHYAIASTRYDENAIAVADFTTDTHEFNLVNQQLWHLNDHGADPWPASELK